MKHRNILLAVAVGLIAALGLIAPVHAGDLAGVLPAFNSFASIEGAGLAMLALAIGNIDLVEIKNLAEKQVTAFEEFKKANDAKIAEIEKKGHASAEALEKVARIEADIAKASAELKAAQERADKLEARLNRPGAGGDGKSQTPEQLEHKAQLERYLRKGEEGDLRSLERKAMTAQSDPDGGFLVTPEMDAMIDRVASTVTSFRGLARQVTIGGPSYKKLVKTRGVSGGWLGESEESSESTAPQFSEIEILAQIMYAEPWVPNSLLEDSNYDLEADLMDEAAITFREVEGTAFINGTGVKQPKGFLSETVVANASMAWGKIGYIATGVSGDFAASNKADKVVDLQHALKQVYRPGAAFLMADSTLAVMRQFKDTSGSYYLWNPDPARGPSGTFLGSPVVVDDYMPVIAANSYSVAYGNFGRGYTIVNRRGTAVIVDRVTKKGTTKFNMTRRVGGGVTNFEAIKLLKFGTS